MHLDEPLKVMGSDPGTTKQPRTLGCNKKNKDSQLLYETASKKTASEQSKRESKIKDLKSNESKLFL